MYGEEFYTAWLRGYNEEQCGKEEKKGEQFELSDRKCL